MPQTIAIDGSFGWFTGQVTLDGVDYILDCAWNSRDSRWYLTLSAADGVTLVASVPLVVDYPPLSRFRGEQYPPGYLMAVDTTGQGREIETQEDLGVRVQLVYLSEAEVEAL